MQFVPKKTTLPYEDNYLHLHPTIRIRSGSPCAASRPITRTTRSASPRSCKTRWSSGFARPVQIATVRQSVGTMGVSTHAYGGTRMGDDPETNVVDRFGFSA